MMEFTRNNDINLMAIIKNGTSDEILKHINIVDRRGNTILHYACKIGCMQTVSSICKIPDFPIDKINDFDETGMYLAIKKDKNVIVKCLLEYGADPFVTNYKNFPICINASKSVAKTIINHTMNDPNAEKNLLIALALKYDWDILADKILETVDDINKFYNVCDTTIIGEIICQNIKKIKFIKKLLEKGASLNLPQNRNIHGTYKFLINEAMIEHRDSQLMHLIFKHADINQIDILQKHTPLIAAALFGNEKCAEILIKNGADMHATTHNEESVLTCACFGDNPNIIKMLIKKNARLYYDKNEIIAGPCNILYKNDNKPFLFVDWNITDEKKCKALENAIVFRLINVNDKNPDDDTLLHYAIRHNNTTIVNICLRNGADDKIKNGENKTPLELAQEYKNNAIIELIKKYNIHYTYYKKCPICREITNNHRRSILPHYCKCSICYIPSDKFVTFGCDHAAMCVSCFFKMGGCPPP
jgi:ankyrin repeat protein